MSVTSRSLVTGSGVPAYVEAANRDVRVQQLADRHLVRRPGRRHRRVAAGSRSPGRGWPPGTGPGRAIGCARARRRPGPVGWSSPGGRASTLSRTSSARASSAACGAREHRVGRAGCRGRAARAGGTPRRRAGARSRLRAQPGQLLADVRDDEPGRVGRRRRPDVGDEVEQRDVLLVADRADDRGRGRPPPRGPGSPRRTAAGPRPLPPPRVMTMTPTSGSRSSRRSASMTSGTAYAPCTATFSIRNSTPGQRRRAFSRTSRSAAEPRPQTTPTARGRNGSGCLRSAANSPSAASSARSCSSRARSSPRPTGRISTADSESVPRLR